jgi:hypothetical protein
MIMDGWEVSLLQGWWVQPSKAKHFFQGFKNACDASFPVDHLDRSSNVSIDCSTIASTLSHALRQRFEQPFS